MTLTAWEETRDTALKFLEQRWKDSQDKFDDDGEHDVIHDIADGWVPVYNADRMEVAADPEVWRRELEIEAPKDADLMTLIGLYIYEALEEALWSHYQMRRWLDGNNE